MEESMEDEQTWNQFVNSNVTVWQLAHWAPKILSGCLKINKSTNHASWLNPIPTLLTWCRRVTVPLSATLLPLGGRSHAP
jgi:hypothetical protein